MSSNYDEDYYFIMSNKEDSDYEKIKDDIFLEIIDRYIKIFIDSKISHNYIRNIDRDDY